MWLNLEVGVARSLQRMMQSQIDVPHHNDPHRRGRRALIVEAAHTYLPEAAIDSLPALARSEVSAGLTGRLRSTIASTDERDPALPLLRDQLITQLGVTADTTGALTLLDQVYAGRLLRNQLPPIVTASCLAWYGYWRRTNGGPSLSLAEAMEQSVEDWQIDPSRRPHHEAQILANARQLVGTDPIALEDAAA